MTILLLSNILKGLKTSPFAFQETGAGPKPALRTYSPCLR